MTVNQILNFLNRSSFGRALLRPLIKHRYKQRGKNITDVQFLAKFRCWDMQFGDRHFLASGPGWVYEYDYLLERLKDCACYHYVPKPGDVVLDIGAGVGEETIVFSTLVGDKGKVYSIEAHPKTYGALQYLVEINKLSNVRIFNIALADNPGKVFIEDQQNSLANTISTEQNKNGFEVQAETFDQFVERMSIGKIDLVKMNVEGAEQLIIKGMSKSINKIRNFAICCHDFRYENGESEFFKTRDIVLNFFRDNGFDIVTKKNAAGRIHDDVYAFNPNAKNN